jgi:O-antigen/teichoic acid export membrane protein
MASRSGSLAMFGVYGIALMLALMPTQAIIKISSSIGLAAYSRARDSGKSMNDVFRKLRLPLLVLGGLVISGLVAGGPYLIRVLYDPRYHEAGWMLQILAIAAWFQILESINGAALLACGSPHWVAIGGAVKLVGLVVLMPLGYFLSKDGISGAIWGAAASDALKYLSSLIAAYRHELRGFAMDAGLTAVVAASALLALVAAHALDDHSSRRPVLPLLVASGVVMLLWSPLTYWVWPWRKPADQPPRGFDVVPHG